MKKAWYLMAVLVLAACGDAPGNGLPDGGVQVPDSGTGPEAPDAGPGDGGQQEGESDHWSALSVPGVGSLNAVWGSGSKDVWAVGESGFVIHWDGEQWAQETRLPPGFTLTIHDIWGSNAQDVWAVAQGGVVLHFDGQVWQYALSPEAPFCSPDSVNPDEMICRGNLRAVWGSSATDVWAVGTSDKYKGVVSHWDGTRWSHTVLDGGGLQDVWGSGATDIWASNLAQQLHWNGETWQVHASGTRTSSVPSDLWGVAANDVWGVNLAGEISHWDGVQWTEVALESESVRPLRAIAGTGAGQMWAVGGSNSSSRILLHWEGQTWQQVRLDAGPALVDLWVLPDGEAWAVGWQGSLLHRIP